MVISVPLMGAGIRYHRVYDGKKYIGIIIIKPGLLTAKIAHSKRQRMFSNKEAAAAWIHKTYWNQEFPS